MSCSIAVNPWINESGKKTRKWYWQVDSATGRFVAAGIAKSKAEAERLAASNASLYDAVIRTIAGAVDS